MNICYVFHSFLTCGGVRIAFEHANRLAQRGHNIYLAYCTDSHSHKWYNFNSNVKVVQISDIPLNNIDAVIATFWLTAYYVNNMKIDNSKKYYLVQHRESLFYSSNNEKNQVENSYKLPINIITISNWLQDFLQKDHSKESFLVRNGLDENLFFPEPTISTNEKFTVLIEGNPNTRWKGIDESYKALKKIPVEIWSLSTENETRSNRHFQNPPQDMIRKIYSSANLLLKTSWYEGLPAPQAEAMMCGCPVITTNVNGTNEYCIDRYNCLLVPPNNVSRIKKAVIEIMNNDGLKNNLIINGFKTVKEKFSWDDKIDLLERIYRGDRVNVTSKW